MNNIISNDCISGIIYSKYLGSKYMNPFAGACISFDHFVNICDELGKHNFSNAKMITMPSNKIVNFTGRDLTYGIDDGRGNYIWYPHFSGDDRDFLEIWNTRLARMKAANFNEKIFILDQRGFNPVFKIEDEDIQIFASVNLDGKKIILTGNPDLKRFENDKTKVFVKNSKEVTVNAELIYLNYKEYLTK